MCLKKLSLTNCPLPGLNKKQESDCVGSKARKELICYWKHVFITRTAKKKKPPHAFALPAEEINEGSLIRVSAEDCDEDDCGSSVGLGDGEQTSLASAMNELTINGNIDEIKPLHNFPSDSQSKKHVGDRTYTYFDAFCGAGAASRGAKEAGLDPSWACDKNADACTTFHLNFPDTILFRERIQHVVSNPNIDPMTDILHISSPCQPYSSARRGSAGRKDKENIAASMAIGSMLDKMKPRIATFENVTALMERVKITDHGVDVRDCWDKISQQITSRGYSVRWKIMKFHEYGLPQRRKRRIMIASW